MKAVMKIASINNSRKIYAKYDAEQKLFLLEKKNETYTVHTVSRLRGVTSLIVAVFSKPAFPFPHDRSRKRYVGTINVPRMADDVLELAHAVNNGRRGDVV